MSGTRHKGCGGKFIPSYIHNDIRCSKCGSPYKGVWPGRRRRSRRSRTRPAALAAVLTAAALLGTVWYFDTSPVDIGGTILDGIGGGAEYGSAVLDGAADIADGGSVVLDNLGGAARDAADVVGQSVIEPALEQIVEPVIETTEPTTDVVTEPVDEPADNVPSQTSPSPFSRTIWPDDTAHTQPEPIPELTKAEQIEAHIYETVNRHREAAGLHPLDRIPKIDSIARAHSQDMADRNYYDHDTPEGLDPTDRGNAAKYPCRKDYGSHYTVGLAENIHMLDSVGLQEPAKIARLLVDGGNYMTESPHMRMNNMVTGWMDSSGHRQNILHADYTRIGIGVAFNDSGDIYATQNFC